MEQQRFDAMLMELLQDRKTIAGFLDAVFGFLSRNTDFYYEQTNKDDKIGFPPGMKEQIVLKVLQKFDPKYRYVAEDTQVPPAINEVEIVSKNSDETTDEPVGDLPTPKDVPKETSNYFSTIEHHNGACFDTYCWSQTSTEIELHIRLPADVKSSKHISINIEANHIKVISKMGPLSNAIFDRQLSAKCKHNDALWTISDGKLNICLDKAKEAWWDRLCDDEPDIDVSKIDCSKYMDELPPDSQAAIEKLRWEQTQKQSQLPKELKKENIDRLREAWNVEGSPFKGQPFDPSLVNFN